MGSALLFFCCCCGHRRTQVEWLLTAASAAQLLPLLGPAARAGAEPAEAGELASGLGTTMDALLAAEIAQQARAAIEEKMRQGCMAEHSHLVVACVL